MKQVALNWSKDKYLVGPGNEAARKKVYETLLANPQNLKYQGELEIHDPLPALARLLALSGTLVIVSSSLVTGRHSSAIDAEVPGKQPKK